MTNEIKSKFTFRDIEAAACAFFQCRRAELFNCRPSKKESRRRFIVVHLARLLTPLSLPQIAERCGYGDHTVALNAQCRALSLIASDAAFALEVLGVTQMLFRLPSTRELVRAHGIGFVPTPTPAVIAATWA